MHWYVQQLCLLHLVLCDESPDITASASLSWSKAAQLPDMGPLQLYRDWWMFSVHSHFSSTKNKKLSLNPLSLQIRTQDANILLLVFIFCAWNKLVQWTLWLFWSHLRNISCSSTTDLFHETPKDNHGDQILNHVKFWFCPFRLMYWTDWGRQPKIECAWMDGQHRQTLVSEDLGWPTGLSIDYLNNDRIYWSDSKENIIESMRPDGTDRTIILHGGKNLLCN